MPAENQSQDEAAPMASSTSISLLVQVKNKNQTAWNKLVEVYSPFIYRVCRVAGVQADDASDVIQEVFLSVSRSLDSFRHDRPQDSFRAWLLVITKNKIRDHFRKATSRTIPRGGSDAQAQMHRLQEITWDSSSDSRLFNSQAALIQRVVQLVRHDFEDKTWQAFWRVTVEGQLAADVAQQLKISRSSVYQSKSRVLRRVRSELASLPEEPN